MSTLHTILNDLSHGEFAGLSVGNAANGGIRQDQYPRLISHLNRGLLDLYTRFVAKKKEFLLYQKEGTSLYYIRSEHVGNVKSGDPEIYIEEDPVDPLGRDIIKILEMYDSDQNEIHINDNQYPDDAFMLAHDTIKIAPRDPLEIISVVYQAAHPTIEMTTPFDPKKVELFFPAYMKNALLYWVASFFHGGKTSKASEGQQQFGDTYMKKYIITCHEIAEQQLVWGNNDSNQRFENNGWA